MYLNGSCVADVFINDVSTHYGMCEQIHLDQGSEFDFHIMKEVCQLRRLKKTRTTSFAPWSNSMVECSNQLIKPPVPGLPNLYVGTLSPPE